MQKQQVFKVKGMQRDASMANANGEFAYEILNMRLMPAEDLSGFSLTNEKGTTKVITDIEGQIIGQCPTNDSLVVFTIGNNQDHIYKIYQHANGNWISTPLYSGNLNFSVDHPIEALFNYETEDIQKVYWIDGLNPLRCINIISTDGNIGNSIEDVPANISVELTRGKEGQMRAGIVQYFITYISDLGSETSIVYMSPLLYIAPDNRGGQVNSFAACSFTLTISRSIEDINFNRIRVYKVYRTSLDATPEVSILENEVTLDTTIEEVSYTDRWTSQTLGPTEFNNTNFSLVNLKNNNIFGPVAFKLFTSYIWGPSSNISETSHYISYDSNSSVISYNSNGSNIDYCTQVIQKSDTDVTVAWQFPLDVHTGINTSYSFANIVTDLWNNQISIVNKETKLFTEEDRNKLGALVITISTVPNNFNINLNKTEDETPLEYATRIWNYIMNDCLTQCISMSVGTSSLAYCIKLDLVNELPTVITLGGPISIVDNGIFQSAIETTELLFKNKEKLIPSTITSKDNTLFLGNLKVDSTLTPIKSIVDTLKDKITVTYRSFNNSNFDKINGSIYFYDNHLNNIESISSYKYGETYRLGIQFQNKSGYWTNPYWIQDITIDRPPTSNTLPCPSLNIPAEIIQTLRVTYGYIAVRPLVVFPELEERRVLLQGVVCPTIYNLADRKDNSPYSQASWFMRPNVPGNLWHPFDSEVSKQEHPVAYITEDPNNKFGYLGVTSLLNYKTGEYYTVNEVNNDFEKFKNTVHALLYDDVLLYPNSTNEKVYNPRWYEYSKSGAYHKDTNVDGMDDGYIFHFRYSGTYRTDDTRSKYIQEHGSWVEFRHNYALRTKGWTFGPGVNAQPWSLGINSDNEAIYNYLGGASENTNYGYISDWKFNVGSSAVAELDVSRFGATIPVNKFLDDSTNTWNGVKIDNYNVGTSAYYVDSSIVTLNSPELELNEDLHNIDLSNYKFRIIGIIPITGTASDVSLEVSSPYNPNADVNAGFHKVAFKNINIGNTGYRGLVGHSTYFDSESPELNTLIDVDHDFNPSEDRHKMSGNRYAHFPIYPWQSEGTVLNTSNDWDQRSSKAVFKKKILSNLRFSADTYFFPICLSTRTEENPGFNVSTENRAIFNLDSFLGWKPQNGEHISIYAGKTSNDIIKLPGYSNGQDIVYKGNIDSNAMAYSGNTQSIKIYNYSYGRELRSKEFDDENTFAYKRSAGATANFNEDLSQEYKQGIAASIKYKSSPHAVISFKMGNYTNDNFSFKAQEILPAYYNHEGFTCTGDLASIKYITQENAGRLYEHQDPSIISVPHQSKINIPADAYLGSSREGISRYGWLWLGEIYKETPPSFGGDSEGALMSNQWLVGGQPVIFNNTHHVLGVTLQWTQGDTYYQRFDTLKTYAYDTEAHNSIVDITSFMVETRINIDGRYDRNRGQESNLQMSPTNFNLINDVYSQKDNFFTYRILDEDLQARTNFPNQITWSLTKTAGATVDAWMNITLASVLDLDGTKGELVALKNFNNNIIAFQEKGLSHIMFNSRAQIATSEAVPIQIANTGKVDGQQYFTTDVGCQDKWNIVTTPNGLYFVDYFNKSIYRFNGKLEDISTPNGFRSWCYENLNSTANIIGYYDVKNKEVMYYIGNTRFTLDNSIRPYWLGFSELTGAFSSFYTYPKAWFANVQDQGLWLLLDNDYTKVYTHQTGNYNQLLNTNANYGLTVIPRQDSNTVKTFNNVEFRADSFDANGYNESILPFDTISAETEYQERTPNQLTYSQYRPSNLKKKLRTWRANIPRVNNGYNRFVNQWAKIGLWKMDPSTEKTILHDLSVWYSE